MILLIKYNDNDDDDGTRSDNDNDEHHLCWIGFMISKLLGYESRAVIANFTETSADSMVINKLEYEIKIRAAFNTSVTDDSLLK